MSRPHRSLKLLNTAINSSGKLQLYTELDHQFAPSDLVYISGGFYDNINTPLYSGAWSNVSNPYTVRPYKVLSVNYSLNTLVIDYAVSGSPKFPYCDTTVTTNTTANPFDNSDKAYATQMGATPNMYRGVYISQVAMPKPRMVKGTVNNGIIGADKVRAYLGKKVSNGGTISNRSDVNLAHCVAKNIASELLTINNKSFGSGLTTTRFRVNDSFNTVTVTVGGDNDDMGYSIFERAFLESSVTDGIRIVRSKVGNQGGDAISIENAKIENAVIGSEGIIEHFANYISNCVFDSASTVVKNVSFSTVDPNSVTNGMVDSMVIIPLSSSDTPVYNAATNRLTFTLLDNAAILDSTFFSSTSNAIGYMTGFTDAVTGYPVHLLNGKIKVVSHTCTYGSANTGTLVIELPVMSVGGREAEFMSKYVNGSNELVNVNFSDVRFWYNHGGELTSTTTVIPDPGNVIRLNTTSENCEIEGSSGTIILDGGHFVGGLLTDSVQVIAPSMQYAVYLGNVRQLTLDTPGGGGNLIPYQYAVFDTSHTFECQLNQCVVLAGVFTNSQIVNTDMRFDSFRSNPVTFIYNSTLIESNVEPDVLWEYVRFQGQVGQAFYDFTGGYYYYRELFSFQGKTTEFRTAAFADLPHQPDDPVWNLNTLKTLDYGVYPAGVDAYTTFCRQLAPNNFAYKFVPFVRQFGPGGVNLGDPVAGGDFYSQYDLGYLAGPYNAMYNRNRLITIENAGSGGVIGATITNILTPSPAGSNDPDMVTSDPVLFNVDLNYVAELQNWYKVFLEQPARRINAMASVHSPGGNPGGGYPNAVEFSFYTSNPSPSTPLTAYYTSGDENTSVSTGTHNLQLEVLAWITVGSSPATKVPKTFVEIDTIRYEEHDGDITAGGTNIIDAQFMPVGMTMTGQLAQDQDMAWNNPPGGPDHPVLYNIPISPNLASGKYYRMIVTLFVQYWFDTDFENCGKRERHEVSLLLFT